jgi:hypothetical protein
MEKERVIYIETCASLILFVAGFFIWWWSQQLVWILIFPPPFEKQLIESMPYICWGLAILIILDALRRKWK